MTAPPPQLQYLLWAAVLLLLTLLQYVFGIRERLRKVIVFDRRLYAYFSYFALFVVTIGVFAGLNYTGNLLLIRALNAGNSGHLISWISIFIIFYRFGYDDFLRGFTIAGAWAAFHELVSVGITLASGAYSLDGGITLLQAITFYSTFFVLLGTLILAYFAFGGGDTWVIMRKAILVLIIYSLVVLFGMNGIGTIDLSGATSYFNNLDVNLVEQLSWIIPSAYLVGLSLSQKELPKQYSSKIFE